MGWVGLLSPEANAVGVPAVGGAFALLPQSLSRFLTATLDATTKGPSEHRDLACFIASHRATAAALVGLCHRQALPPDTKYIALTLLACFVAAAPAEVAGPRSQAVAVATCVFVAWKYSTREAQLEPGILSDQLLARSLVRAEDVLSVEAKLLTACRFDIFVPRWWQLATVIVAGLADSAALAPRSLTQQHAIVEMVAAFTDRVLLSPALLPATRDAGKEGIVADCPLMACSASLFAAAVTVAAGAVTAEQVAYLTGMSAAEIEAIANKFSLSLPQYG